MTTTSKTAKKREQKSRTSTVPMASLQAHRGQLDREVLVVLADSAVRVDVVVVADVAQVRVVVRVHPTRVAATSKRQTEINQRVTRRVALLLLRGVR